MVSIDACEVSQDFHSDKGHQRPARGHQRPARDIVGVDNVCLYNLLTCERSFDMHCRAEGTHYLACIVRYCKWLVKL